MLLDILLRLSLITHTYFIRKISRIIEKTILCRSSYAMLALDTNLNYSINTLSSHHSYYKFAELAVATMFVHRKITFFKFKHEGICLQAVKTCIKIYPSLLCRNDTVTWKKSSREDGFTNM